MASKKAYLEHLRNIPLFSACSNKDLEKIAKAGDEVVMPSGSLIVDQGQTGREAFVIISGTAVVKRNGKKVANLGPARSSANCRCSTTAPARRRSSRRATSRCSSSASVTSSASSTTCRALAHKLLASLAGRIRDLDRQYYG